VVDLREQPEPAVRQAVDEVELPQGPRAVQRTGEDARDGLGEAAVVARRRDRALADVEVEVEVGVVDPVGQVDSERDVDEPAAQGREQVDALRDEPAEVGHLQPSPGRRGGIVDREHPNVAERPGGLDAEELGVERAELLHARFLPDG
jgi:hypothetical protein